MEYRKIGKWGLRVSEIGLGSWLTYGGTVSESESISQVHYAYERGVNFFDTANVYAHGQGEETVGEAIKTFPRESVVLATKVFFPMGDGANDRGLSRKHIFEQCHQSLRRLQTDYIDLYQCHRYDSTVPLYEIVQAMDDLTCQGKILYWGVSEWSGEQIDQATKIALENNAMPPISNQPQYNMLSRKIEGSVIPICQSLGVGQLAFSPLAQGVLTGKYKPGQSVPHDSRAANNQISGFMTNYLTEQNLKAVEKLTELARSLNMSMSQLALAWCLRLPDMSSVIIGATKLNQIEDNLKASGKKLPANVLKEIDELLKVPVY